MTIKILLIALAVVVGSIIIITAVEEIRYARQQERMQVYVYVPSPDLSDRETPPTYQDLSDSLIEYANELAQQLATN